jgi:putative addiction module component (TIGR02574 family)
MRQVLKLAQKVGLEWQLLGKAGLRAGVRSSNGEVRMAQMTPQVSEVLEKALSLSEQERELLIDRLSESLNSDQDEAGLKAAWDEEIKRRVDDIRSGRVKTIPGEQVLREMAEEFPDSE